MKPGSLDGRRRCGFLRNKFCIACLIIFTILISLVVGLKIFIDALLKEVEEDSFSNSTLHRINNEVNPNRTHNHPIPIKEIPERIKRGLPHTFAGFDNLNQPVWLLPYGRWDVKTMLSESEENEGWMKLYADDSVARMKQSIRDYNATKFIFITDMSDYSYAQLTSFKAIALALKLIRRYEHLFNKIDCAFIVNLDYFGEILLGMVKPVLGDVMDRIQTFGSNNKEQMMKTILERIPASQLPPQFGGLNPFKPVKSFYDCDYNSKNF